jgi:hypothetical protein
MNWNLLKLLKKKPKQTAPQPPLMDELMPDIRVYPSQRSCIRLNMNHVKPEQLPPLMVRKAAWRR